MASKTQVVQLQRAYESLSGEERDLIDKQVKRLLDGVRERKATAMFGRLQALEVLAALGVWLNAHGTRQ